MSMLRKIIALVVTVSTFANITGAAEITAVDVYPPTIELTSQRDRQGYVVVATRDDGVTLDLTKLATATIGDAAFARREESTIFPVADGETTLSVQYEGRTITVPVSVKNAAVDAPISFHNEDRKSVV